MIFDEIHYINDVERGVIWEESIIFAKENIRFLCLSATIPNYQEFADWISSIKDHDVDVVYYDKRPVPLEMNFYDTELGITTLKKIKEIDDIPDYNYARGLSRRRRPKVKAPSHIELIKDIKDKLPCFFFTLSRVRCETNSLELAKTNVFETNPEIGHEIRKKLKDAPKEISGLKSMQVLRKVLQKRFLLKT